MRNRIRRQLGFVLVIAMLIVMIYPGETGSASEDSSGFAVDNGVLTQYVGAENSVVIPDTVTAIGDSAFQNMPINSVTIPSSVTSIGAFAFAGCTNLTSINIPSSVASIGSNAFANCTSLSSVSWQSGAGIPAEAFNGCRGLTSVSIAQTVPSIGSQAFKDCSELPSIAIPAATSSVAANAFDGCVNMSSISVDAGNPYYTTSDGCLYSSSGVALFRCPQGKNSVIIQQGTQTIEGNAFYGCKMVEINIPSSVTVIKLGAFMRSEVETLILGDRITVFEEQTENWFHSIKVPGSAPAAGDIVNKYNEIVETDYKPVNPPDDTEDPNPPDNTEDPNPPDNTEDPNPPDNTEDPNPPDNTEDPNQPDKPDNPNTPDNPNNPGNSDKPNTPDNTNGGNSSTGDGNTGNGSGTNNGNNTNGGNNTDNGSSNNAPNGGGASGNSNNGGQNAAAVTTLKNGIPNLSNNANVSGWEAIINSMQQTDEGKSVGINMNGATKVPKEVLSIAKEKKQDLVLNMDTGITWNISGKDITSSDIKDIDFGVKLGTSNVPKELQNDVAGSNWSTQMHLSYNGVFGMTATLKVMLGKAAGGHTAILYYYNEAEKKMEYISQATVTSGGEATFTFAHASDYVIVVDGLPASTTGMSVTDAHIQDNTPTTGPGLNAKYILCLGVMLFGVYMILTSKKETYQTA